MGGGLGASTCLPRVGEVDQGSQTQLITIDFVPHGRHLQEIYCKVANMMTFLLLGYIPTTWGCLEYVLPGSSRNENANRNTLGEFPPADIQAGHWWRSSISFRGVSVGPVEGVWEKWLYGCMTKHGIDSPARLTHLNQICTMCYPETSGLEGDLWISENSSHNCERFGTTRLT